MNIMLMEKREKIHQPDPIANILLASFVCGTQVWGKMRSPLGLLKLTHSDINALELYKLKSLLSNPCHAGMHLYNLCMPPLGLKSVKIHSRYILYGLYTCPKLQIVSTVFKLFLSKYFLALFFYLAIHTETKKEV